MDGIKRGKEKEGMYITDVMKINMIDRNSLPRHFNSGQRRPLSDLKILEIRLFTAIIVINNCLAVPNFDALYLVSSIKSSQFLIIRI